MEIKDSGRCRRYYQALVDKDPEYLGIFYAAVKTTGVFCLSTCRARKPLRKNVIFYEHFKDVLEHGYRPCKICRPTVHAHAPPPNVLCAIRAVHDHPKKKIRDQDLRDMHIQPEAIRRWFKKHFDMTFHAYQRMYRINQAYLELKQGSSSTDVALHSGYESLSGFGYTYKKLLDISPNQNHIPVITIDRYLSPIGPMFVAVTDHGLCLLEFTSRKMLETEMSDLQKRLNAKILTGHHPIIQQTRSQLDEYFDGRRQLFDLPLDMVGTAFQKFVWQGLLDIPYARTTTYQRQARLLNRATSVRAVANANGQNKIAIIIPCHRVIGSDGRLTGYGGGLERKRWLLDHEARTAGIRRTLFDE